MFREGARVHSKHSLARAGARKACPWELGEKRHLLPKAILTITTPRGTKTPGRKGRSMMKRLLRIVTLLGGAAVLLSALSLQTSDAQAAPSSGQGSQHQLNSASCGTWQVVKSPNGNGSSGLNTVAVASANAIWAVGNVSDPQTRVQTTLIEYWNGTQWQIV